MSDLREVLEREGERFALAPGGLERLHRRRRRREHIQIAALALAAVIVGSSLAINFKEARRTQDPAQAPRILSSFSIGARPVALAEGAGAVWIVSAADRKLVRLDLATGEVINEVSLADDVGPPADVTISRGSVWVRTAGAGDPRLSQSQEVLPAVVHIDASTGQTLATLFLDHETPAVAVGAGGVWSTNTAGVVFRRDVPRGKVEVSGQGPAPSVALAVDEGGVWALGGGRGGVHTGPPLPGTLARMDPDTGSMTSSTEVGRSPRYLAVGEGAAWVVSSVDGAVFRVDSGTVTVTDRIPVPGLPTHITVGPTGVWVLDAPGGMLYRIDPDDVDDSRVTDSVSVGAGAVALTAAQQSVWVAREDGTILRIGD
jgi:DNA-binding beta-propeller fold protein YncE